MHREAEEVLRPGPGWKDAFCCSQNRLEQARRDQQWTIPLENIDFDIGFMVSPVERRHSAIEAGAVAQRKRPPLHLQ
jgi:hypothetical protein